MESKGVYESSHSSLFEEYLGHIDPLPENDTVDLLCAWLAFVRPQSTKNTLVYYFGGAKSYGRMGMNDIKNYPPIVKGNAKNELVRVFGHSFTIEQRLKGAIRYITEFMSERSPEMKNALDAWTRHSGFDVDESTLHILWSVIISLYTCHLDKYSKDTQITLQKRMQGRFEERMLTKKRDAYLRQIYVHCA